MANTDSTSLRFEGFTLDLAAHTLVDAGGRDIALRRSEFELLRAFLTAPGRALNRDHLLEAVAGRRSDPFDRSIDVLVGRLRRKIEPDPKEPRLIVTVLGVGYRFAAKPQPASAESGATPAPPRSAPAVSPERRQLTVLRCGLCGPALSSARRDPEDLQRLLVPFHARCAAIIQQAGGTVPKRLGETVLAYFGYPQAHEDEAERAIRAALRLIEATGALETGHPGALQARVGIATGLVLVGDLLGAGAAEPAVLGEAPDLAAGLLARAEPGTVLIGATTYRLIGETFQCREQGPIALHGFADPLPAWQVIGDGVENRFEALRGHDVADLVGREEELSLLLRRWAQAKAGAGRVVLLTGEPGIGKSRLVRAVQERLEREAPVRLRYFCSPHHRDSPLHPVIAQLEGAAGFGRDDTAETKFAKLKALLARSDATDEAIALIARLLSIPAGERYRLPEMSPQKRKERTFEELLAQLAGLTARQPVLMIFEDLHWIDPSSLELLSLVVERLPRLPVLLLITARPELKPPWSDESHVSMQALTRLSRANAAALIELVSDGKSLPIDVKEQILARTDGVPLFIEELTKSVLESVSLPPLAIPASLHDLLLARLDRLGPTRELAQIGAAIGREFSYGVLRAVAALSDDCLQATLRDLVASELVMRRGMPPEAVYIFKHSLVQDAAYATMPRHRRRELHARIVAAFEAQLPEITAAEPVRLAEHCMEAGLTDKAVRYWLAAGRQASARSLMAAAATFLRKGLALLPNMPDGVGRQELELDLQIALGKTAIAINGHGTLAVGEAYAHARRLCDQLDHRHKYLSVLWGQWIHHVMRAEMRHAQQHAAELRQLGEERNDVVARVMGCRTSGFTCLYLGDFAAACAHLERGIALYDPLQRRSYAELAMIDPWVTLLSWWSLALVMSGSLDQARSGHNRLMAEARRLDSYTLAAALHNALLIGWVARADPASLLQCADEYLALSVDCGFAFHRARALATRGWCLAALGHAEQGIPLVEAGVTDLRASQCDLFVPDLLTALADACRLAGQPQTALAHLTQAERLAEATEVKWVHSETLRLRGDLLMLTAKWAAAEASFREAIALARRQGAKLWELRATISLARLRRDQGRGEDAHKLLGPIYDWFTEGFDTPDLMGAKALLDEPASLRGRIPAQRRCGMR